MTSPPYWGLRDYGTASWDGGDPDHDHAGKWHRQMPAGTEKQASNAGAIDIRSGDCACGARRVDDQIGLESTPSAYVAAMVDVFAEIWRVLRPDGTVWLNLGDSYVRGPLGMTGRNDHGSGQDSSSNLRGNTAGAVPPGPRTKIAHDSDGLKIKDLVGIPWRVAFALQDAGWWLRSDIVWAKPNPMPESVTDRPTRAHEFVFLLTKSPHYFYDVEAVREPFAITTMADRRIGTPRHIPRPERDLFNGQPDRGGTALDGDPAGRNMRSVWFITLDPYADAHFATFPKALVVPCIKAGTSERGACPECGAPWVRIVERVHGKDWNGHKDKYERMETGRGTGATDDVARRLTPSKTLGWEPSCDHAPLEDPVPCVVLDPFCGSGTVGLVALRYGRSFIGIDLNPGYVELARNRIIGDGPLFNVPAEIT